jgi:hypothetical protein
LAARPLGAVWRGARRCLDLTLAASALHGEAVHEAVGHEDVQADLVDALAGRVVGEQLPDSESAPPRGPQSATHSAKQRGFTHPPLAPLS